MDHTDLLSNDLQVSPQAQSFLNESARWGKFLSIVGFIFVGLMAILSLTIPSYIVKLPPYNQLPASTLTVLQVGITIVYFAFAILFFFPCLFLNRFSFRMQRAIQTISQENFEDALSSLKSMFRFYGILTIIMLSLYALLFFLAMIGLGIKG